MVENIEKKVLGIITPTNNDKKKLDEVVKKLREKVKIEIEERKLPVKIEIVGSIAKDTYLKNNLDIDLFIIFPTDVSKDDIAKNSLSIGRKLLKNTEECYAEHPYIRGFFKEKKVEIVPCFKIEKASQKVSAVDRTPLHTRYIIDKLKESQKQEVRLFKQFLSGIGCYGAEAEVEGFSGYLCEILIIKYETFKNLLNKAKNWKTGEKLALSDGKNPSFDTPLTFIDPVDSERNVASALTKERFDFFINACKEYMKNPNITFFFPNKTKPWSIKKIESEIKKQGNLFLGIQLVKPDIITENLYPQLRKASKSIWDVCKRYDFIIYDVMFFIEDLEKKVILIVNTKNEPLSNTFIHNGPPVKLIKNVNEFINKWNGNPRVVKVPFEEKGRIYVELERDYTDIKDFIKNQFNKLSLGRHIDEIKKNFKIIDLKDLLKEELRIFWTEYLDGKMPWER